MKNFLGAQKEIKTGQIWKFSMDNVLILILILKLEPETEDFYERAYCYYSFVRNNSTCNVGTHHWIIKDILSGFVFLC